MKAEEEKRDLEAIASLIEEDYMAGTLKWATESGKRIEVSKMTVEHITNTINFLERSKILTDKWIEIFEIEIERRTDNLTKIKRF